jgi:ABC-2 type transport system ATP-binding protein
MMLGLITPSAGEVRLFGRDPHVDGARALDGVAGIVEGPRFYPYLSGLRNLRLLADLDGGSAPRRIDEVLDIVELRDRANDKVGGYSHGMRQRLGIAASLLRDPTLLLLDEPTTGLDPAGMRDMRRLVKRLAGEGITILLSSHILAEVEELCNRVAIIRSGRIIHEGRLDELLQSSGGEYRLRTRDQDRARAVLLAHGIDRVDDVDGELRFRAEPADAETISIALGRAGIGISALVPHTATLEELFLGMTEQEAA